MTGQLQKVPDERMLDSNLSDSLSELAEKASIIPGLEVFGRLMKEAIHLFQKSRDERVIEFIKELAEYSKLEFEKLDPNKNSSGSWKLALIIRDLDNSEKCPVEKIRAYAHFLGNSYKDQDNEVFFVEDWKIIQELSFQELVILSSNYFLTSIGYENPVAKKYPELVYPPSQEAGVPVSGYGLYYDHSISNLISRALLNKDKDLTNLGSRIVLLTDLDRLIRASKPEPPYTY
jgi:hypothetical protein